MIFSEFAKNITVIILRITKKYFYKNSKITYFDQHFVWMLRICISLFVVLVHL